MFHAELGDAALASVVALIERTIDPAQDDVRIYRLPAGGWTQSLGVSPLPRGIGYVSLPQPFRAAVHNDGEGAPGPASGARTGGSDAEAAGQGPGFPARPRRPGAAGSGRSHPMGRQAREVQARIQTGIRSGLQVV